MRIQNPRYFSSLAVWPWDAYMPWVPVPKTESMNAPYRDKPMWCHFCDTWQAGSHGSLFSHISGNTTCEGSGTDGFTALSDMVETVEETKYRLVKYNDTNGRYTKVAEFNSIHDCYKHVFANNFRLGDFDYKIESI